MKSSLAIVLLLTLVAGCQTTSEVRGNVEDAFDAAANPQVREFEYRRDAKGTHYYRQECSGDYVSRCAGE